jgi:hypothetical protein
MAVYLPHLLLVGFSKVLKRCFTYDSSERQVHILPLTLSGTLLISIVVAWALKTIGTLGVLGLTVGALQARQGANHHARCDYLDAQQKQPSTPTRRKGTVSKYSIKQLHVVFPSLVLNLWEQPACNKAVSKCQKGILIKRHMHVPGGT